MKKYEKPEIIITELASEDIITASAVGFAFDKANLTEGENIFSVDL